MEISVVVRVADLIAANLDISALESDDKSLHGAVNESKTKIETNASNIGTINSDIGTINSYIGCIHHSLTGLDDKGAVFERNHNYTNEISDLNISMTGLKEQMTYNNI